MAATSQPLATQTAVEVLRDGGSAVDAAIAANAMLGLVEPTGCGPGGDLFAIVWDPAGRTLHGLNASGRSSKVANLEAVRAALSGVKEIPTTGPWSVTVPGCIDGWFELHGRFGKLEMARLLAPVINTAREGFRLTPVIAREWAEDVSRIVEESRGVQDTTAFLKTFATGGRAPRAGEAHVNPDLADFYMRIVRGGRDAFYEGELAERISEAVRRQGGILTAQDLAAHHSEWVEPVSAGYRGYEVFELPPNGQGIAALQMLLILEAYPLRQWGFGSAEALHAMIEAKKLAFEDRARFIADPAFVSMPLDRLRSPHRVDMQRKRIDPASAMRLEHARLPLSGSGDTCYLTAADRDGMMVSLIQSNFTRTGSGIVPAGLGFGLQSRGALFSLDPDHANAFAPGKRPFHTIIPAFVFADGRPLLSFGVMGGDMQPQGHVQVLTNLIDFGMTLQEAGDAPRWRHVGSSRPTGVTGRASGSVLLESGFGNDTMARLEGLGHAVEVHEDGGLFGGYQAIGVDPESGDYVGATERRKDGKAMGL